MGVTPEVKLVVRRTFIELVEEATAGKPRLRAFTDTALVEGAPELSQRLPESGWTPAVGSRPALDLGPLQEEAVIAQREMVNIEATNEVKSVLGMGSAALLPAPGTWCLPPTPCGPRLSSTAWDLQVPAPSCSIGGATSTRTTLMLRNLPNDYTRGMLLELLDAVGFAGQYDLVYLPVDFGTGAGLGYAFVNLHSPADAEYLASCLSGFSQWVIPSEKVCEVAWSQPHQGFAAHVERYRNSPVMHPAVPDEWKPAVFCGGARLPFPSPTRPLKAPKPVRGRRADVGS